MDGLEGIRGRVEQRIAIAASEDASGSKGNLGGIRSTATSNSKNSNADLAENKLVSALESSVTHADDVPLLGLMAQVQAQVNGLRERMAEVDQQIEASMLPSFDASAQDDGDDLEAEKPYNSSYEENDGEIDQANKQEGNTQGFFVTGLDIETEVENEDQENEEGKESLAPKVPIAVKQAEQSLDDIYFPGFKSSGPVELPGLLSPLEILDRCLETQTPSQPAARLAWRTVLTLPETQELIQDAFWWFFCQNFQPSPEDQFKMFDRMANNFVGAFLSCSSTHKDEVFANFHTVISQSVLSVFEVSISKSRSKYTDSLKIKLSNLISSWCSGAQASHGLLSLKGTDFTGCVADLCAARDLHRGRAGGAASLAHAMVAHQSLSSNDATANSNSGYSQPRLSQNNKSKIISAMQTTGPSLVSSLGNALRFPWEAPPSRGGLSTPGSTSATGANSGKGRPRSGGRVGISISHDSQQGAGSSHSSSSPTMGMHKRQQQSGSLAIAERPAAVPPLRLPPPVEEGVPSARSTFTQRHLIKSERRSEGSAKRPSSLSRPVANNGAHTTREQVAKPPSTSRMQIARPGSSTSRVQFERRGSAASRPHTPGSVFDQMMDKEQAAIKKIANSVVIPNGHSSKKQSAHVVKVVAMSLVATSPLVRHWLSTRASNDTRNSQFVKIASNQYRDKQPAPYYFKKQAKLCYQRAMEQDGKYEATSKRVARNIAESRRKLMIDRREIDMRMKAVRSAAAAHTLANDLVARLLEGSLGVV